MFSARVFQIGDDQRPDTNDIGHTSARRGLLNSFVIMAFVGVGRHDIQSRVSAPLSRFTMNSIIANLPKLPITQETVHCKQRLNRRRPKLE